MNYEKGIMMPTPVCADGDGKLPSCAPLAVPYVPFQQAGAKKYSQNEALNNGTLFPGLNLPFRIKSVAEDVVNTPLAELQALDFVCLELAMYLDTHKDDLEAFDLFRNYSAMAEEGRRRYEQLYGPLSQRAAAAEKSYEWCRAPWPWELQNTGGGK